MALPKLNTPTYNLNIPSNGKEINYRPYLVREEKILMIAMESDDMIQVENALLEIIKSCVTGIDVNELTRFDSEYVFSKLRAKSVGETAKVAIKCEECDHSNEVVVNIDSVSVTNIPSTPNFILEVRACLSPSLLLMQQEVKEGMSLPSNGSEVSFE